MKLRRRQIVDPAWSDTVARIIRSDQSPRAARLFEGVNSHLFQILGLIHPRLRTLMLPREMFRRSHKEIRLRVGKPIPLKSWPRSEAMSKSWSTCVFERICWEDHRDCARRRAVAKSASSSDPGVRNLSRVLTSLARIPAEVEAIPSDQVLIEPGAFLVFHAGCRQIPALPSRTWPSAGDNLSRCW